MKYLDKKGEPWNEWKIQRYIIGGRRLQGYACIPNVFMNVDNGYYEADMILIQYASGFLQEIEIKVSIEDFAADFKKKIYHNHPHVRQFSYAMPTQMWREHEAEIIKLLDTHGVKAGIIVVDEDGIKVVRRAKVRKNVGRLKLSEMLYYLRIGCLKI